MQYLSSGFFPLTLTHLPFHRLFFYVRMLRCYNVLPSSPFGNVCTFFVTNTLCRYTRLAVSPHAGDRSVPQNECQFYGHFFRLHVLSDRCHDHPCSCPPSGGLKLFLDVQTYIRSPSIHCFRTSANAARRGNLTATLYPTNFFGLPLRVSDISPLNVVSALSCAHAAFTT